MPVARRGEDLLEGQHGEVHDLPILHHGRNATNILDVLQWITVEDHEIGELAGLERPELIELVIRSRDVARQR